MSEQLGIKSVPAPRRRQVLIGGFPQNFYMRAQKIDTYSITEQEKNKEQKTYLAQERKELPSGFVDVVVEKDYPINSESVSSYIETSDYRLDPQNAIAKARKRVNLGDITQAQEFMGTNPIQASTKYSEVMQKVADYFKAQEAKKAQTAGAQPAPSSEVNNG